MIKFFAMRNFSYLEVADFLQRNAAMNNGSVSILSDNPFEESVNLIPFGIFFEASNFTSEVALLLPLFTSIGTRPSSFSIMKSISSF